MIKVSDALKRCSFGGVYVVYNDDAWLKWSLESVYEQCEVIYILVSDRPWNGPKTSNETTIACAAQFPDPQSKIRMVRGSWDSEADQRNAGLTLLMRDKVDYCFIVDADEIYCPIELRRMMVFAACLPDIQCWHMQCITYWKTHLYRIEPPEQYYPAVFIKIGEGVFENGRNVTAQRHATIGSHIGVCHHMSYARTDEQVKQKIASFSHAHEVIPDWFEKVWRGWDKNPTMRFLNPAYPAMYDHATPQPLEALPPALRRYAAELQCAKGGNGDGKNTSITK